MKHILVNDGERLNEEVDAGGGELYGLFPYGRVSVGKESMLPITGSFIKGARDGFK